MAQFTLTVTVSINPKYDNPTTANIAKNDVHNLLAQWASRYGHSVVVAEDVDHEADPNCDCDTCADNREVMNLARRVLLKCDAPHSVILTGNIEFAIEELNRVLRNVKPS